MRVKHEDIVTLLLSAAGQRPNVRLTHVQDVYEALTQEIIHSSEANARRWVFECALRGVCPFCLYPLDVCPDCVGTPNESEYAGLLGELGHTATCFRCDAHMVAVIESTFKGLLLTTLARSRSLPTVKSPDRRSMDVQQHLSQLLADAEQIEQITRDLDAAEDQFETNYLRIYQDSVVGLDHQARSTYAIAQVKEQFPDLWNQIEGLKSNRNAILSRCTVLNTAARLTNAMVAAQAAGVEVPTTV